MESPIFRSFIIIIIIIIIIILLHLFILFYLFIFFFFFFLYLYFLFHKATFLIFILLDNFAYLFNCTPVDRGSDLETIH